MHGSSLPPSAIRSGDAQAAVRLSPLICFSHLRWDFVTQRPQHLMRRFARTRSVFFWEEHIPCDHHLPYLEYHPFVHDGVVAVRPRIPHWWSASDVEAGLKDLLDMLIRTGGIEAPLLWFYTPMLAGIAERVVGVATVYDCMDELSAFRFADPTLVDREERLLARADVVFTGGSSLYEIKRQRHRNVHAFPSAVEVEHFRTARKIMAEPEDQSGLTRPRLGFYGVIDERIDLGLIDAVASARPDWSIVMIGPIAKIDPALLPLRDNIHWLGARSYDLLPTYLAGWDVALMPFAINDATRFISPTKTPEYLAGGLPVVSTAVTDVVRHYGGGEAVAIASDAASFVAACEAALALSPEGAWRAEAERLLDGQSWDLTQAAMQTQINKAVERRRFGGRHRRAGYERYDAVVVGAGFAGAVMAERLAADAGQRVLVIDRRSHVGGNAFDEYDSAGLLVHRYGPHIFHTNSAEVFEYLSRFTAWRPYEHRVLADVAGTRVPMPINRTTLNLLYGLSLNSDDATAQFLAHRADPGRVVRTSEDVVVAAVGRELYETFFRGYTRKQWGLDPSELDAAVTARLPTRTSVDDRYFTDRFQAMPAAGFTRMFEAMLDHPNIALDLGTDYRDIADRVSFDRLVFTGPIDEFFDHRFGKLPYRSLTFRHETHDVAQFQPVAVVNYPDETIPHTRVTEYKHLTGQTHAKTSISYEFPSADGDPYYPVPRPENQALFKRYEALADALSDVTFVGRLATYRYYNMDQVVAQALATYRRLRARTTALSAAE